MRFPIEITGRNLMAQSTAEMSIWADGMIKLFLRGKKLVFVHNQSTLDNNRGEYRV
jgi:hypothetical protein